MKGLLYYPAYFLIWLISLLPLRMLFIISDFIYLLLFYLVRYRREVVTKNLCNAFPEKSPRERHILARRFYRHLADSFIESVYPLNMNKKEHCRRYRFKNPEILNEIYQQNRNVLLMMSHHGNWEWSSLLPEFIKHRILAIYKPLQNKKFDKLVLDLRGKYGVIGVPMESTLRTLIMYEKAKEPVILCSLADQRPQWKTTRYWARFMNQDSAILAGSEKLSRRFNMAVLFLKVSKLRRGCYEAEFLPVSMEPKQAPELEITRKYFDMVESVIREKPEYWLWSHNRWKYNRLPSKDSVDIDEILSR